MRQAIREQNRNFWLFLIIQAVASATEHAIFISVALYTYRLTGSALSTAGQMITAMLPLIILAGWAGQIVDRHDAQRTILFSNILRCVVVLLYPLTSQVWQIYAINIIRVIGTVFFGPAQAAFLRAIIGRDKIVQANGMLSIANGIIALVVPGLTGVLITEFGESAGFWFTSACYGIIVLCTLLLPSQARAAAAQSSPVDTAADAPGAEDAAARLPEPRARAVWAFIRSQPGLLLFLIGYSALNLGFWASDSAFIPYTEDILSGGATFGLTLSVYYASTILSGTLVTVWGKSLRFSNVQWLFLIPPFVWFGYSLVNILVVVLVLVFVEGLVRTTAEVYLNGIITAETPAPLVGQVWSVVRGLVSLCTVIGALLGALATERLSILGAFRTISTATVAALLLIAGASVLMAWYKRARGVQPATKPVLPD